VAGKAAEQGSPAPLATAAPQRAIDPVQRVRSVRAGSAEVDSAEVDSADVNPAAVCSAKVAFVAEEMAFDAAVVRRAAAARQEVHRELESAREMVIVRPARARSHRGSHFRRDSRGRQRLQP
jgi:hypothetical protein